MKVVTVIKRSVDTRVTRVCRVTLDQGSLAPTCEVLSIKPERVDGWRYMTLLYVSGERSKSF